jgi:hypothetical protein
VRRENLVLRTTVACAVAALAALIGLAAAGRPLAGAAVGAGLLIGSLNGWLAERALGAGASFLATSLGRLALLSGAAIALAWAFGLQTAPLVLAGVAGAQLVLVAVAILATLEAARR